MWNKETLVSCNVVVTAGTWGQMNTLLSHGITSFAYIIHSYG